MNYNTTRNEQIVIRVALSYVSIEEARMNLESEAGHLDFEQDRNEATEGWNKELTKIKIEGASDEQKEIFFTSLNRSLLAQYIYQDTDRKYFGMDGNIHETGGFDFYGTFSCWDIYRTQHPLLTIIAPGRLIP